MDVDASDDSLDGDAGGPGPRRKPALDDYGLVRVVGKGSFGKVLLVRHLASGAYFAMKVLTKSTIRRRRQVEHTKTERSVLARVRHPLRWSPSHGSACVDRSVHVRRFASRLQPGQETPCCRTAFILNIEGLPVKLGSDGVRRALVQCLGRG